MDERKKQALERLEEIMANLEEAWLDPSKIQILCAYSNLTEIKAYIERDINIGVPKKKAPKPEKEYCCPCHWYGPRSEAVIDGDTVRCPCCGSWVGGQQP